MIDENAVLSLHQIPESQDDDNESGEPPVEQAPSKFADFTQKEVLDLKFSTVKKFFFIF